MPPNTIDTTLNYYFNGLDINNYCNLLLGFFLEKKVTILRNSGSSLFQFVYTIQDFNNSSIYLQFVNDKNQFTADVKDLHDFLIDYQKYFESIQSDSVFFDEMHFSKISLRIPDISAENQSFILSRLKNYNCLAQLKALTIYDFKTLKWLSQKNDWRSLSELNIINGHVDQLSELNGLQQFVNLNAINIDAKNLKLFYDASIANSYLLIIDIGLILPNPSLDNGILLKTKKMKLIDNSPDHLGKLKLSELLRFLDKFKALEIFDVSELKSFDYIKARIANLNRVK